MTKNILIATLATKYNLTREQAASILNSLSAIIIEQLNAGEKVQLTGFGTFEVKTRDERMGRNPYTGESIHIGPSRRVSFTPGKNMKASMKSSANKEE